MQERDRMAGKRVGLVLSGGNIDRPLYLRTARGSWSRLGANGDRCPTRRPRNWRRATVSPAARCRQLVAYYDRYGVGRNNNSDGRRNHTRIGA